MTLRAIAACRRCVCHALKFESVSKKKGKKVGMNCKLTHCLLRADWSTVHAACLQSQRRDGGARPHRAAFVRGMQCRDVCGIVTQEVWELCMMCCLNGIKHGGKRDQRILILEHVVWPENREREEEAAMRAFRCVFFAHRHAYSPAVSS